jgi:negative regulator of flagellin synthesis FlgM
MKIGNPAEATAGVTGVRAQETTTANKQGGEHKPAAARAPAADASAQVQLSAAAAGLLGAAGSDFDADKVARISQAIESGSFKVNAEAIADKLLANARELLGKVGNGS